MTEKWEIESINGKYALLLIINDTKYVVMDGFDNIDELLRFYNKLIQDL